MSAVASDSRHRHGETMTLCLRLNTIVSVNQSPVLRDGYIHDKVMTQYLTIVCVSSNLHQHGKIDVTLN